MEFRKWVVGIVTAVSLCFGARAQQAGSLDPTFNPGAGANGTVLSIALQTNGQILVAGDFTTFNNANRSYVARLNTDGSLDTSFDPGAGPNSFVTIVAVQADGKILIGGTFDAVTGFDYHGLARLRPDGSLDIGFTNDVVVVRKLAVQNDGNIVVAGIYPPTSPPPQTNLIARLTLSGRLDPAFKPAYPTGSYGGFANALAFQSDGRIIVGGPFEAINGIPLNYLARLNSDGTVDTGFNAAIGGAGGSTVFCLAVTAQDQIVIGGTFSSVNGYSRNGVARLNSSGAVDTKFNPGLGPAGGLGIRTLAVQPDGKVIVGGDFTSFDGTNRVNLVRLNVDGTLDLTFDAGMTAGNSVASTALQPDGKTIVGCSGGPFHGIVMNGVARLNADNSTGTSVQFLNPQWFFGTYLQGVVSNTYRIEWSTNLTSPIVWTPLFNVTIQTNPQFIIDPTPPAGPPRLYRAVALP